MPFGRCILFFSGLMSKLSASQHRGVQNLDRNRKMSASLFCTIFGSLSLSHCCGIPSVGACQDPIHQVLIVLAAKLATATMLLLSLYILLFLVLSEFRCVEPWIESIGLGVVISATARS